MTAKTASPLQALLSLDVRALLDSFPAAIFVKDARVLGVVVGVVRKVG